MREIRPSGSVRGVRRKPYPYRGMPNPHAKHGAFFGDAGGERIWRGREKMRRTRMLSIINIFQEQSLIINEEATC